MPLQQPPDARLYELEIKWLNGTITDAEAAEYAEWYNINQDLSVPVPEFVATNEGGTQT